VVALLIAGLGLSGVPLWSRQASVAQPLRFSHRAHVKQAKCGACHTTVTKSLVAGVPTLADCLDCHEGTQSKSPADQKEEAKIETYAKANAEIPWMRVWRLPSHVFFSHRTHVAVGEVKCQTCHGPIETLDTSLTRPLKTLTMDECIGCHEKWERPDEREGTSDTGAKGSEPVKVAARRVSTDCNACHR
jgi:hypothetical protein